MLEKMFETIKRLFKKEEVKKVDDRLPQHEKFAKYNEMYRIAITHRALKLGEEVRKKYEDVGIHLISLYNIFDWEDWEQKSYAGRIIYTDISLTVLCDLEAIFIPIEDNNALNDIKQQIDEHGYFEIECPHSYHGLSLCNEVVYKLEIKARMMTEEEVMQRKMLKEMGIQQ